MGTLNLQHLNEVHNTREKAIKNLKECKERERKGLDDGSLVAIDMTAQNNGVKTIKIMKKEKAIKLGLYEKEDNANKHS